MWQYIFFLLDTLSKVNDDQNQFASEIHKRKYDTVGDGKMHNKEPTNYIQNESMQTDVPHVSLGMFNSNQYNHQSRTEMDASEQGNYWCY